MTRSLRHLSLSAVLIAAASLAPGPAIGEPPAGAPHPPDAPVDATVGSVLRDEIKALVDRHDGEVSVAIRLLSEDETVAIDGDRPMPTASLIKFPLMIAAYQAIEEGSLDLDQRVTLEEEDKVPGSGILTANFSGGTTISLADAIGLMITFSDNTATNLVADQVGLEATARLMETLDCPDTKLHSKVFRRDTSLFPDRSRQFGLGSTTANEMIRLLDRLHRHELVSPTASEKMLAHLHRCESRDKIPRSLPAGTKVAHKTGAISSVRCDAGLVYSGEDAFAICVLTRKNKDQRWSDDNAANVLCGDIAKLAYDHFFGEPDSSPADGRPLRIGGNGLVVESLQRTLNARMTPSPEISVDGDFGPNTEATVMRFQESKGLPATGEVDEATWSALGPLITDAPPVADPATVNAETQPRRPADKLSGPPHVTCKAWAIVDARGGELLAGFRESESLPMASTTKIMTAHLVFRLAATDPQILREEITFSQAADETIGSTSGVRAGETIVVSELLYGLLLPSGNDASVALAEHFGPRLAVDSGVTPETDSGPIDLFVAAMNREAVRLGLESTHFTNTHGLSDPGHRSSAADLARLAWEAMQDDSFCTYVNTSRRGCTVRGPSGYRRNLVWRNTNRLLRTQGYDGVKTGTTSAAGACLVSRGRHGDAQRIVVVLGSASSDARYADTRNLFRWAFAAPTRSRDTVESPASESPNGN